MAIVRLLNIVNSAIQKFEYTFAAAFLQRFRPDSFCIAGVLPQEKRVQSPKFSLKDLIGDGFLYAVPKHRRSLEKRMKRKFGHPDYVLKILKPKSTLRVCNTCGDDHEVGVLCTTCYKKVIEETKAMQEKIQEELKLEPVEKEVVVLYEGEKDENPNDFYQGKRIVEMKKARPSWFSKNLTQQSTQQPATTKDVKPTELG